MTSYDHHHAEMISRPSPVPEAQLVELYLILCQGNEFLLKGALLHHLVEQQLAKLLGVPEVVHEQPPPKVVQQQPSVLSPRETQVLRLAARELRNEEIGEALGITGGTVKNHMTSILGKLKARSRWQAVERGRELGLV